MKLETRLELTMGLFIGLSVIAACNAAQTRVVHDTLDGVHAVCQGADPALHLLLSKTEPDGGSNDSGSTARD
jgi:hypothetical protein